MAETEKIAEEIESIESTGNIHVAEERNQEVDRKGIGEGKELRSSSVLRTGADVAIKATGAAESDAGPPPVTAKDEGSQPNSSRRWQSVRIIQHSARHMAFGVCADDGRIL